MGRVTINDIARLSGYSKTSVSFAFNDPARLSERARSKIMGIAGELGYVPDPSARNLSLRRHGTIGLLLPQIIPIAFLNPYFSQIVQGIGDVCEQEGYSLTLIPPVRESMVDAVRSAAVDGLITLGLEPGTPVMNMMEQRSMPFVTIDGRGGTTSDGVAVPVIAVDDRSAASHLMRYVLSLGHRRIAILRFADAERGEDGAVDAQTFVVSERLAGYRDALVGADVDPESVVILPSESSLSGGREAVGALLDEGHLPTAIIAMSDVIAIGAIAGLEAAGVQVPDEVSVVGFDDIPESTIVRPALTTISQPGFEKGREAARVLTTMLAGGHVEARTMLATRLTLRESCISVTTR